MTSVLIRDPERMDVEKRKRPCKYGGRDWRDATARQGTSGATEGGRRRRDPPLEPLDSVRPQGQGYAVLGPSVGGDIEMPPLGPASCCQISSPPQHSGLWLCACSKISDKITRAPKGQKAVDRARGWYRSLTTNTWP